MSTGRFVHFAAAGLIAVVAGAVDLSAQTEDARWLPWVGCWESVGATAEDPVLCFRPAADGVEFLTVVDGRIEDSRMLRADGIERPVEGGGCFGSETITFSDDGARIYQASEQQCEGGGERSGSGIITMISPDAWIDVRAAAVGDEQSAWVSHYRTAAPSRVEALGLAELGAESRTAIQTARALASRPPSVDDVIEANGRVHDEAVRVWVAEAAEPMDITSDELIALDDAGVSPEIIDVVVAVSHPEYFAVGQDTDVMELDPTRPGAGPLTGVSMAGRTSRYRMCTPFGWDPFYSYFLGLNPGCGYRLGYGYGVGYDLYDRWGYPGSSLYGYYGYRRGPVIIVERGDQNPDARVINGRGYRRNGTGTSSAGAPSSRPTTSSGARPTMTRGSGASAGSASSGSTGSTTRRAKPRRGGGGGGGLF